MKQIVLVCGILVVMLVAVLGSLVIFGVMDFSGASTAMLKFGGGIVLLGVCAAVVTALLGGRGESG